MNRTTERSRQHGTSLAPGSNLMDAIERLADYEDLMERWKLRELGQLERILLRVNAAGGVRALPEAPDEAEKLAKIRRKRDELIGQTCEECENYKPDAARRSGVCAVRPHRSRSGQIIGPVLHVYASKHKCLDYKPKR